MLQRLKLLRKTLEYTQSELAKYLSITQTACSVIENGIRPLSDKYARAVCVILNISEHYLLTKEGEIFQSSPYKGGSLTLYGKPIPEAQEYLLVIAKELLKIQQKLLHEGESRHLRDEE